MSILIKKYLASTSIHCLIQSHGSVLFECKEFRKIGVCGQIEIIATWSFVHMSVSTGRL